MPSITPSSRAATGTNQVAGDTGRQITTHHRVCRDSWRGVVIDDVECYYGLRYATLQESTNPRSTSIPSTGQLDVEDMTHVPVFPQLPSRLETVTGTAGRLNPQTDDAFFLNVWAPAGVKKTPVLVYIHGGAWASGGGAMQWYRGQRLAAEGIVVVTVNYRLGPAGHLEEPGLPDDHRPFNDLTLALKWVAEHIQKFGGDPENITLAGQSAGAWYTWALASLPQTKGLFRQIALLSIPQIQPWSTDYRRRFSDQVHTLEKQQESTSTTERLLKAGAQVLAQTPRILGAMPPMYLPMLAGEKAHWLSNAAMAAERMHASAVYLRITQHEMSVFLPPYAPESETFKTTAHVLAARAYTESLPDYPDPKDWTSDYADTVKRASWFEFGRFTQQIADAVTQCGHNVVLRDFSALSSQPAMGAVHCMDLPFQFGNKDDWTDAPMLADWSDDAFETLSKTVRQDLAQFVCGHHDPVRRELGRTT